MDSRYSRQIKYIGEDGQRRLEESEVCIVGCGSLGSLSAELLAMAGVGCIVLVDRDFVDISNLQRQRFTERDAADAAPKATALASHLKEINSSVVVTPVVDDFNPSNAEKIIKGADIVLDCLDNMESRFVLNEACAKRSVPWVHASCIRAEGYVSFVSPGKSCLNCFVKTLPYGAESCETAGVLNASSTLASAVQANEALAFLAGKKPGLASRLLSFNLEKQEYKTFDIVRDSSCRVCVRHDYSYLEGRSASASAAKMCGQNSYHISPAKPMALGLGAVASRCNNKNRKIIAQNDYLVRIKAGAGSIAIFRDARAIAENITLDEAKKIYRMLVLV